MERIWLEHYPKGIPADIEVAPSETLLSFYQSVCQRFKDNTAFSCHGESLSYEALWRKSSAFASYLQHELGLKKGDRLAIMMPNLLQYPVALFGAFQAGLVVVNLNPLDKGQSLKHEINDSGAKAVIVLENFVTELQKVVHEIQVEKVVVARVGDLYPLWKRMAIHGVLYLKNAIPKWQLPRFVMFDEALNQGYQKSYQPVELQGSDIAFLQYTGGTTGVAKGVVLSHSNMVANIKQAATWMSPVTEISREIIITALPLYHIFSLLANCLVFMSIGGENVLITDPRNIPSLVRLLHKVPYTAITGVNTLFNALLHHEQFRRSNFKHLKVALGGGMAIQKAVAEDWLKVTGKPICQAYGLTEASPAVCINPPQLKHFNESVGLPLSSTWVSIRDAAGQEVPLGEVGELWVKGPQVMQGYWHREAETQSTLTSEGWLKTADAAKMDDKGYVYIVDRLKDMVIVSGFNVYPAEIEQLIKTMPGVNEVAVIGIPDSLHGEVVKAFIVPDQDAVLTERAVIQFCHTRLAAYKCPRAVEFRTSLPKSNVGKILKKELRVVAEPLRTAS